MAFTITKIDPESRITIVDNTTYFDVEYNMGNRNINTIVARLNFTKDTADLTLLATYKDTRKTDEIHNVIANDNYFDETYTDSSGVITLNNQSVTSTGKYRILYNPIKCEEIFCLRITPTSLVGNDTLVIDINENALGA